MNRQPNNRPAFSVLELLIVLAILAVVVSLVTVGVQRARATADRICCANNLRSIGMAMWNYHVHFTHFPTENGDNPSFYKSILPYVERNTATDSTPIKEYLCPVRRSVAEVGAKRDFGYPASTAYDTRGPSILDGPSTGVSLTDVGRGATHTFLLTTLWMDPKDYIRDDPTDLGWSAKRNSRQYGATAKQDSDPSGSIDYLGGPFKSDLPVLFADGHVEWVAYLAYTNQWSYSPSNKIMVRITVPNNAFQVEFGSGSAPGDFDDDPAAPGK